MSTTILRLVSRDAAAQTSSLDPTMAKLLIAVLILVFIAISAVGGLMILRSVRRARRNSDCLPLFNEKSASYCSKRSNHRRLTISTTPLGSDKKGQSVYVIQEKKSLMDSSTSPPPSPIPEIRITFPDEVDQAGKRQSGRVVVVRVGEHSVGLEPVQEKEDLPPYMRNESSREFQSLDLERMGGLKEKEYA